MKGRRGRKRKERGKGKLYGVSKLGAYVLGTFVTVRCGNERDCY